MFSYTCVEKVFPKEKCIDGFLPAADKLLHVSNLCIHLSIDLFIISLTNQYNYIKLVI